VNTAYKTR